MSNEENLLDTTDFEIIRILVVLFGAKPGYDYFYNFKSFIEDEGFESFATALSPFFDSSSALDATKSFLNNTGVSPASVGNEAYTSLFIDLYTKLSVVDIDGYGQVAIDFANHFSSMDTSTSENAAFADAVDIFNQVVWESYWYSIDPANTLIESTLLGQIYYATLGSDDIQGSIYDDTFIVTDNERDNGLDFFDGNDGRDLIEYRDNYLQYEFSINDEIVNVLSYGNLDQLTDFEYIKFHNQMLFISSSGIQEIPSIIGNNGNEQISGGDGVDYLNGLAGDDYILGGAGNDFLYGGSQNDILDGGTDNDYLNGGSGSDIYYVDSYGDQVIEINNTPEGTDGNILSIDIGSYIDTVFASVDYILSDYVENLDVQDEAVIGIGNDLNNQINGNMYSNQLFGGNGNDNIFGDKGDDSLIGERGHDTLHGGGGLDKAIFISEINDYEVVKFNDYFTVTQVANTYYRYDGSDKLIEVERLEFSDKSLALDIEGSAGLAAKVIAAVHGSESINSNLALMGEALDKLDIIGYTYPSLIQWAMDEAGLNGTTVEDYSDIVSTVWENVFGVLPNQAESDLFVYFLASNTINYVSLGYLAAEGVVSTGQLDLVGLAETGIEYIPYEG